MEQEVNRQQVALERQAQVNRMTSHIIQQVMQETRYKPDIAWGVFHVSRLLGDTNELPHGVTHDDIMDHYYKYYEGE